MHRASVAALLALSTALSLPLAAPALAAAPTRTVKTVAGPVQEVVLPNGFKVILKESHTAPVVTWVVYYKVGSRNEAVGWTGSTHLLEHMMFKGTKTLGKGQIAQLLERNGADYNATTAEDRTNYFETYSSDKLELGIRLEADRMRNSLLLDSERRSEMTVVRNEMERGESNPETQLYEAITIAAYRSHPYHHPVIGWRSDVESVPTSRLVNFYNTYYQPNNAVGVLVGDFKPAEALALIKKYIGTLPAQANIPPMYTTEEPQMGQRRVTQHVRGETNLVQAGWHIPDVRSADIAPLKVLEVLLGSGRTSRLYQGLVEHELATDAWAECGMQHDPSLFRLGLTLRQGVSHQSAETAALAEIEKLKTTPVTEHELQKAKNQTEASTVMQKDGTEGLAFNLGEMEAAAGNWQRSFELLDQIKKVKASDLQRVAKLYLSEDNATIGWTVASADGPVPPTPQNAGSGKAVDNGKAVKPLPLLDFERVAAKPRPLVLPIRKVLSNGMTVLVLENHNNPTVSVNGFVRAGHVQDPAGKEGLATLVAHMLGEGTLQRDKLALAQDLEFVGASVGFTPGNITTGIGASMLSKDLDLTLGVIAEELMTPSFPASELAKLKANSITAIKSGEDHPDTRATRAFMQSVLPKSHPSYQQDPADEILALDSIGVEDLKAFHAAHYGPNATTLIVVGDVQAGKVFDTLEKRFATWSPVGVTPLKVADSAQPRHGAKAVVSMMDKTSVSIIFGNSTTIHRKDPDFYAAQLANYILGGSPLSARLGVKLRDQMGLTYDARSVFFPGVWAGPWYSTITVNAANVTPALKALHAELDRFVAQGVTADELAKAKSTFIGSQAVTLATNGGMADSLSRIEQYGLGLDFWRRYSSLIQAVSLDSANRTVRKMVQPGQANLAIAGPVK